MADAPIRPLAHGRLYRLRAGKSARACGYVRFALDRGDGAPRERFAPLGGELNLLMRAPQGSGTAFVHPDDASIEPLGWRQSALALMRRRYNAVRRSVLDFDGVEIFPDGSKAKTRKFRKQLLFARSCRMAFDGPFVTGHPELLAGWPTEVPVEVAPLDERAAAIAVALHLHYVELWDEIETLLRRWRAPFTLFLTLTCDNPTLAARVRSAFPGAVVRAVDNQGRDVRPFLQLLEDGAFDSFDVVCKIHGKRSLGGDRLPIFGDVMRRAAYLDLIVGDNWARGLVERFRDDVALGLVGPRRFLSASRTGAPRDVLGPNRAMVEALAQRMGAPIRGDDFDFFEGTMFWARPQALAPLRRLGLAAGGAFAPEAGQVDGALEHAVERLFNHAARSAGYRVEEVSADD
ncbi:MAG: rhamnan synthesis F family protein [Roseiarcus sp.]